MLKNFLLIPLAMCAGLIFPLLQKIVAGIPLSNAEWSGFSVIAVVIIALVVWITKLDKDEKTERKKELEETFKEVLNKLGIKQ
jgi:hypothetical protein